jgi:Fe-S-cluster containining protein
MDGLSSTQAMPIDAAENPESMGDNPWFADGLRFHCTSCGKCCTGSSGSVYLSPADLERLAAFLQMTIGTFARRYTKPGGGQRVLKDAPGTHDCIFLADNTCSVYEARPTQCRTYPWWIQNVQDPESWQKTAAFCEGINHPDATLIPASEILEQCQQDLDNEADLIEQSHKMSPRPLGEG